ncbi:nucleotide sugar dehydrogenase [bacterium]|nr:nucleotide sugar dehydrogenase [bacterium]
MPLALALSKYFSVKGYDSDLNRINDLKNDLDYTNEVSREDLIESSVEFEFDPACLAAADIVIVTVPTPIDKNLNPDLSILKNASATVGSLIKKGSIVVYESTVYPGVTEDICVPILKKESGLDYNKDFFVGYSPERINPGDDKRKISDIVKVVSGSTPETLKKLSQVYGSIIKAGIHCAESIKIAEAAKVIENTQRDVNIALVNELAMLFDRLEIDTQAVLNAAATKWNFLNFSPGLVGGHCIGVDPYYLTHKAKEVNFQPNLILAGRSTNDKMAEYAALKLVKHISSQPRKFKNNKVLVLGYTFKENCPDTRNTKIKKFVLSLIDFGFDVSIYDPVAVLSRVEPSLKFINKLEKNRYGAVVLAVPHKLFIELGHTKLKELGDSEHIFYDLKSVFEKKFSDLRL